MNARCAALGLTLAVAACAAYAEPIGVGGARHLLARTGFGVTLAEIDAFAPLDRAAAVDRVLAGVRKAALTPVPPGVDRWVDPRRYRDAGADERKELVRRLIEDGLALKGWWVSEMLATDSPLTERMTLFWHNHFTSGLQKVRSPRLMLRQNELYRRDALGSFAELLHAASRDPAMLIYLDTARNRQGAPNENFAREVMELFTLGEGRYSEQDIREAARAFTGWSLDPAVGEFMFRPMLHDAGEKSVLGRSGRFDGDDVIEILLGRYETAEFVVAKLWKEFVSPQPDAGEVRRVAALFRASGYSTRAALRELLLSEAFWAPENRAALIKSPVELVVGALRQFNIRIGDPPPIALLLRTLGQDLFSPPNVKGWPGGEAWINSQTLLARKQFLDRLLRVEESRMLLQSASMDSLKPGARRYLQALAEIEFSAGDWLRPFAGREAMIPVVLLAGKPAGAPSGNGIEQLRSLAADPVYQLK